VQRESLRPAPGQVRIAIAACAVCRTDLHVVDGELPAVRPGIVPGHEIVGRIVELGEGVVSPSVGERVGVPWLGWVCGHCDDCRRGRENLCAEARFTGCQIDGGFATEAVADARFVFALPDQYSDIEAAPLLCAGLIGWRAWRMSGKSRRLGLYGFGAAAHIVCQLVPLALAAVRRGGTVICGGIHMSDIPAFPYARLWGERTLRSVANLSRQDGVDFLGFAALHRLSIATRRYALDEVNVALDDLRAGRFSGAAVLVP
jgi:propanol-preferring alcohol dehydrogenase